MSEGIIIRHGSSGSGSTLTINTLAGVTVMATKDDKTKITIANSQGIAVIKGLTTGTWQVSIDDATHEPTTPIPVEIIMDYNVTIVFFTATIKITYPKGSTCTATDNVSTFTAPDTSGTWTLIVPNEGTWTVECTNGSQSAKGTVKITADGQSKSINLSYNLMLLSGKDQCESVTGGWEGAYASYDYAEGWSEPSVDYTDAGVSLSFPNAPGYINGSALATNNPINFDGYKTLSWEYSGTKIAKVVVVSFYPSGWFGNEEGVAATVEATAEALDVRGLKGSYYIVICASNSMPEWESGTINNIQLKP